MEEHLSLEDRGGLGRFKELAFSTPPGKVSAVQMTSEGGLVLHVKSKLPLDQAKMNADLPGFVNYERQKRQGAAFDSWFRKEMEKGLRDTPLGQPRQPPAASSGAAKS